MSPRQFGAPSSGPARPRRPAASARCVTSPRSARVGAAPLWASSPGGEHEPARGAAAERALAERRRQFGPVVGFTCRAATHWRLRRGCRRLDPFHGLARGAVAHCRLRRGWQLGPVGGLARGAAAHGRLWTWARSIDVAVCDLARGSAAPASATVGGVGGLRRGPGIEQVAVGLRCGWWCWRCGRRHGIWILGSIAGGDASYVGCRAGRCGRFAQVFFAAVGIDGGRRGGCPSDGRGRLLSVGADVGAASPVGDRFQRQLRRWWRFQGICGFKLCRVHGCRAPLAAAPERGKRWQRRQRHHQRHGATLGRRGPQREQPLPGARWRWCCGGLARH